MNKINTEQIIELKRLHDFTTSSFSYLGPYLSEEVLILRGIIERLIAPFKDDPCRYDHHGYCQSHFLEEDCSVKRAISALENRQ